MKYEKPVISLVSAATKAIESDGSKIPSLQMDSIDQTPFNTVAPYRSDE